VFWSDQDVIECQVRCSNGRFSGVAEIYVSQDDLPKMASALEGFPRSATDSRDLELGTCDPSYADGGIRLHCYCKDCVGHAVMEVTLRGDGCKGVGEPESVALILPVEAAGVDEFLAQVRAIDPEQTCSSAFLPMAGH